jgi:ABC-2 type transport system permease protein
MKGFGRMFTAELQRFLSRRLFRWLGLAVLVVITGLAVITFFESSKDPNSGVAQAQRDIAACERAERQAAPHEGEPVDFGCGTVGDLQQVYDERYRYAQNQSDTFQGFGVFLMILGLVGGASFVGAEWGTGSMTTLLTWEPRRGRVLLAKLLAAALLIAAVSALILFLLSVVFLPAGIWRGTMAGAGRSFAWSQASFGVRGIGLSVFGSAVAIGLATLLRSTAGAIGVGFFYGAIADFLLSIWREGFLERWMLRYNIARLLDVPVVTDSDAFGPPTLGTQPSAARSALLLTAYAVGFLGVAWAAFRSRDVT